MPSAKNHVLISSASVLLGALFLAGWFLATDAIDDYLLFVATGVCALGTLIYAVVVRRAPAIVACVTWVALYVFFSIASAQARDAAFDLAAEVAASAACKDIACVSERGGTPVLSGAAEGVLVRRLGATVHIRFFRSDGSCRLVTDYLFGREKSYRWACPT